ncbi:MAG: hypothetical protein RR263_04140 [Oscillospiraceae bacterium]
MKKSTLISIISLLVAMAGLLVALAAYLKRNKCVVCDDLDDDLSYDDDDDDIEYYATQIHPNEKAEACDDEKCDCDIAVEQPEADTKAEETQPEEPQKGEETAL